MRLDWKGGFRFVGTDSRGAEVAIDDEAVAGAKGSDLLVLSLATCLAYDVVSIMRKSRQDMTGLHAEIDAEQEPAAPFAFRRIAITFVATGEGLKGSVMERAIRLARKECSVLWSLSPGVEVVVGYRLDEA